MAADTAGGGTAPDNAPAESLASISDSVGLLYDRVRRHSTSGCLAPAEYERTHNLTHR